MTVERMKFLSVLVVVVLQLFANKASADINTGARGVRPVQVNALDGSTFVYPESHALLIGNTQYESEVWPDLINIKKELEQVKLALEDQEFLIYKDKIQFDLKGNELRRLIREFIAKNGITRDSRQNRLLIYYSGHGETLNGVGYLVPVDAPSKSNAAEFYLRAIPMTDVQTWSRQIQAQHVLFIFDSCFSGTIFESRSSTEVPPGISALTAKPVRAFLTAGEAGQTVPAKSEFTPLLVQGIRGAADLGKKDGYITASELYVYLHPSYVYPLYPGRAKLTY